MAGVYISYPFCGQKCTYCNFASGVLPAALEREYLDALRAEIADYAWPGKPETVYLGGGSPDRMDGDAFERLLASVPEPPWEEATIEAAPGFVGLKKARLWSACGINRASLGVQSFNERELRRTGRKHTAEIVASDVQDLRAAGIEKISIDLIAGLPGQTAASWAESLEWVERLAVGHVSVYMLEIDEDSRLGSELLDGGRRYGAGDVPDAERIADFYETAVERLAALGLHRYEISNFAREGHESIHNLKYWRLEPYAGFGADAHSFDGKLRRRNVESAADYVVRWKAARSPVEEETPAHLGEERFFVGLRLSAGIVPLPEEWRKYREPIDRFVAGGLLERRGDRLRLTGRGVLLSNEVFQEFLTG